MTIHKLIAVGVVTLLAGTATTALAQADAAQVPVITASTSAAPLSMRDAILVAVDSNPEIAQAQYNTEAIQFERKQAQGLYAPRVDVAPCSARLTSSPPSSSSAHRA